MAWPSYGLVAGGDALVQSTRDPSGAQKVDSPATFECSRHGIV